MINLIPQKAKKDIIVEYWVRVVTAWFILWAIALFVSAGILFPAYYLIGSQVSVYETSAVQASKKLASYDNVSESLVQASKEAKVIIDESNLPIFSDYISLIEGLQGDGIQVSKIQLNRDQNSIGPILLSGIASDRQTLASFRDRLLESEQIVSVDLPISNLANDSDIQFNITVTLANENSV